MDKLKWIFAILVMGILVVFPQITEETFGRDIATNKTITLMIQIFTVAALASSWNILGGYAGQINLGHAAFFGLGALTTRLMWLNDYPLVLSLFAGGVVATIFALIIGAPALRLRGIYFAIGTLALAEALHLTIGNTLPAISALPGPKIVAYDLVPRYYLILGLLVTIVAFTYWLTHAKLGLGIMAVREDEAAAEAIGVNAFRHKLTAFVISAFFAGLTGSTFAYFHVSYYFQFTFTPVWTFDAVLVAFIGGVGTVAGPLLGAIFFVLVRDVLAVNISGVHLIIFGLLFILVVLILPGGLMELWERIANLIKPAPASKAVEGSAEMKGGKEAI